MPANISDMHSSSTTAPADISLKEAFWYWLKLGFISFGGPAGQIAIMHTDLVEKRRWISERRFLHALNYCMLLPGPEATQLAIYIGWLLHRTPGGILAGALFVLPSLLLLGLLSWIYIAFGDIPVVAGILYGIKPAIVAVVLAAAWRIGTRTLRNAILIAIAIAAFLAIAMFDVPFPAIVLAAALIGVIGGRTAPHRFDMGGGHSSVGNTSYGPALIDDDAPTPPHARFTWIGLAGIALAGITLALSAGVALATTFGVQGTLTQMAWFFTKAAMLTFGGAYAVLPYVYQGAVDTFGWLTGPQMIDGLALGETTPGPLIMIVAFVGFIGGWTKEVFGPGHELASAAAGAGVATFFTFLPSFIFILAGGPLVESTRNNLKLTAPLTAISASVVGVIVSLAVFFANHVFGWQNPAGEWDLAAMAIALAAGIALFRYKIGTIPLIGACAVAGLVVSYLH